MIYCIFHYSNYPIFPFIERVQWLAREKGISTILVAGSSGSYFHPADTIIQMDHYRPTDITAFAKKEAAAFPAIQPSVPEKLQPDFNRKIYPDAGFREERRTKMKTQGMESILVNHESIDLRYVEQIADPEQVNALSSLFRFAQLSIFNGKMTMQEAVGMIMQKLDTQGLELLAEGGRVAPNLAMPRRQEIFACLNRCRSLCIKS